MNKLENLEQLNEIVEVISQSHQLSVNTKEIVTSFLTTEEAKRELLGQQFEVGFNLAYDQRRVCYLEILERLLFSQRINVYNTNSEASRRKRYRKIFDKYFDPSKLFKNYKKQVGFYGDIKYNFDYLNETMKQILMKELNFVKVDLNKGDIKLKTVIELFNKINEASLRNPNIIPNAVCCCNRGFGKKSHYQFLSKTDLTFDFIQKITNSEVDVFIK